MTVCAASGPAAILGLVADFLEKCHFKAAATSIRQQCSEPLQEPSQPAEFVKKFRDFVDSAALILAELEVGTRAVRKPTESQEGALEQLVDGLLRKLMAAGHSLSEETLSSSIDSILGSTAFPKLAETLSGVGYDKTSPGGAAPPAADLSLSDIEVNKFWEQIQHDSGGPGGRTAEAAPNSAQPGGPPSAHYVPKRLRGTVDEGWQSEDEYHDDDDPGYRIREIHESDLLAELAHKSKATSSHRQPMEEDVSDELASCTSTPVPKTQHQAPSTSPPLGSGGGGTASTSPLSGLLLGGGTPLGSSSAPVWPGASSDAGGEHRAPSPTFGGGGGGSLALQIEQMEGQAPADEVVAAAAAPLEHSIGSAALVAAASQVSADSTASFSAAEVTTSAAACGASGTTSAVATDVTLVSAASTVVADGGAHAQAAEATLEPPYKHRRNDRIRYPLSGDSFYPVEFNNVVFDSFGLRVVYERDKTGFEESKEFRISEDTVVAARYQIKEYLGSAAFSRAVKCVDLEHNREACMKIIKNDKDFFDQSLDEIKLLKYINVNGNVDEHNVLRLYDYFYHKEHLIIVTELLRDNLYEWSKYNRETRGEPYFTLGRIQRISHQVLVALDYIHSLRLIHCDLKPENILIKSYSRCEVKVIDFGSSCFVDDHLSSYVQSRSYRAPEVMLGLPYDRKIDIWSLGCILAELWTGYVLFQNDSVQSLLARILGIVGEFPYHLMTRGRYVPQYFTQDGQLYQEIEGPACPERGRRLHLLVPKKTSLEQRLRSDCPEFLDFIGQLLQLDAAKRPTSAEALKHPFLTTCKFGDGL